MSFPATNTRSLSDAGPRHANATALKLSQQQFIQAQESAVQFFQAAFLKPDLHRFSSITPSQVRSSERSISTGASSGIHLHLGGCFSDDDYRNKSFIPFVHIPTRLPGGNHDQTSIRVAEDHPNVPSDLGLQWPPTSYCCSFCDREFSTAQALGGHMNVHRRQRAILKAAAICSKDDISFTSRGPCPAESRNCLPSHTCSRHSPTGPLTSSPIFSPVITATGAPHHYHSHQQQHNFVDLSKSPDDSSSKSTSFQKQPPLGKLFPPLTALRLAPYTSSAPVTTATATPSSSDASFTTSMKEQTHVDGRDDNKGIKRARILQLFEDVDQPETALTIGTCKEVIDLELRLGSQPCHK